MAYAKQQPQEVQDASAGPGANPHLTMELMKHASGLKAQAIRYKSGGASAMALVSGEVTVGFGRLSVLMPQVKAGKLRALAPTGANRFPAAPAVATAAEGGVAGLEMEFWIGLLAQGAHAASGTPEAFAAFVKAEAEAAAMQRLIEATGMRAE